MICKNVKKKGSDKLCFEIMGVKLKRVQFFRHLFSVALTQIFQFFFFGNLCISMSLE